MKIAKLAILTFCLLTCTEINAQQAKYKKADVNIDDRVNDLIGRMTLDEKIGQLICPMGWPMYEKSGKSVELSAEFIKNMNDMPLGTCWAVLRADPWTQKTLETGLHPKESAEILNKMQKYAVEKTRLGIPILFAEECPHGHMAIGTTVFPTGLSQASSFDRKLMHDMGEAIALEVRSQGAHIGFGPVIDIARDPRWSRMEETFGEDPYLTGQLASQIVKGMQGYDIKDGKHIYSTLKHFAAYGISESGLNGAPVNIGIRSLMSEYIPQFRTAIQAGASTIMTSYNTIDGIPCTANKYLLNDILRDSWGFKGSVISDLYSINVMENTFHIAETMEDAASLALKAGVDIDLGAIAYGDHLKNALNGGRITIEDIDKAVKNVLKLKFEMGLFENPYINVKDAEKNVHNSKHIELARKVAQESIILLKNDDILPLSKNTKSIAVIGPNADNIYNQLGDYTSPQDSNSIITVLKGIRNAVPYADVKYVKGCAVRDKDNSEIGKAVEIAKSCDVTILVVGGSSARDFKTSYAETGAAEISKSISDMECGEGYDRSTLALLGDQQKLMQALIDANVKLVVVYIEGRALDMNLASEKANALCLAWYPGEQGGNAIADVLFGDYNPAGRLPVSIPRTVGQIPIYYSKIQTHDYVEESAKPLYSFGYGLSYANFTYSDLQIKDGDKNTLKTVSCTITNTGNYDGDEVVQLYINDIISSVQTPNILLKGFERISLKAGESKKVEFSLTMSELSLINQEMQQVVELGEFEVMVGSASDDIRLRGKFKIE